MKIAILGTGYVGLVAGVCFADSGHEVFGVDSNQAKIEALRAEKVPFFEPGLDELPQTEFQTDSFRLRRR